MQWLACMPVLTRAAKRRSLGGRSETAVHHLSAAEKRPRTGTIEAVGQFPLHDPHMPHPRGDYWRMHLRTFRSSSEVNTKPRLFHVAFVMGSSVEHSTSSGNSRHLRNTHVM